MLLARLSLITIRFCKTKSPRKKVNNTKHDTSRTGGAPTECNTRRSIGQGIFVVRARLLVSPASFSPGHIAVDRQEGQHCTKEARLSWSEILLRVWLAKEAPCVRKYGLACANASCGSISFVFLENSGPSTIRGGEYTFRRHSSLDFVHG